MTDNRKKGIYKNCLICKDSFYASRAETNRGGGKYCSPKCNYKKKKSKETLKKMSRSMKLTHKICIFGFLKGHIPPHTGRKRINMTGSKHWNWKGNKTNKMKRIRSSFEYKQWRKIVFERDDYTCQICGNRGVFIQADHIKPFAYYPELRFAIDNGRTLCLDCHKKTETYKNGSLGRNDRGQFYSLPIQYEHI